MNKLLIILLLCSCSHKQITHVKKEKIEIKRFEMYILIAFSVWVISISE